MVQLNVVAARLTIVFAVQQVRDDPLDVPLLHVGVHLDLPEVEIDESLPIDLLQIHPDLIVAALYILFQDVLVLFECPLPVFTDKNYATSVLQLLNS